MARERCGAFGAEDLVTPWQPLRPGAVTHTLARSIPYAAPRRFRSAGQYGSPVAECQVLFRSTDVDECLAVLDFHRISLEIDAGGRTHGLASSVVETAIVLGAFNDVIHDQTVRKVDFLMRAESVRGVIFVVRRPVDRESPAAIIEADHIFSLDFT